MPRRRRVKSRKTAPLGGAVREPVTATRMDRILHFMARFRAQHIVFAWLIAGAVLYTPAANGSLWARWFFALPLAVAMVVLLVLWIRAAYRYRGR